VNHFAREAHIDEIATQLEVDPLEFRLSNLDHPRFRRVLETAGKAFDWAGRKKTPNTGYGVALGFDAGSYVAECVELTV
jgi:CO/xanthine dehydrogenase Mo-binding subunit